MCKGCCKKCSCAMAMIAKVLIVVGGVNWGLVGLGMMLGNNLNVVNMIFGSMPTVEAIVYVLVGVAAIMSIFDCKCQKCVDGVCSPCGKDETTKTENNM